MNLSNDQLRQNAAAMIAFADGKPIEYQPLEFSTQPWLEAKTPSWSFKDVIYRPKPEPVTRPWSKPEDVPGPVCWIRSTHGAANEDLTARGQADAMHAMILTASLVGITYASKDLSFVPWDSDKFRWLEHSTDRKTWKACVTEEK